jgi:hypothetical protein|tara:strand:+ start:477 stop:1235 length:759 start_codon:yes stop_codon:yes gene_type:complete
MTSELKVDKITPASGTNTQIGEAGDTTNLSAGTVTLPTSIITGASEKTTLVDADKFLIADSADSNAFKHVQKSNLPSGGLVKIVEKTVDSGVSEVVFQNVFTSTYRKYLLVASMIRTSSDATINLRFLQADGTSEFSGAYYNFVSAGRDNGGNFESDQGNGDTKLVFCTGGADADSSSDGGMSGAFYFLEPYSTSFSARVTGTYQWRNASNEYVAQYFGGKYSGTAIRTGFKLYPGSGNIAKCYATLYGVIN